MKHSGAPATGSIISALLPEGRFKEFLRSVFWRRYDPLLALDRVISKAQPVSEGVLLVELKDGSRLYAPRDSASLARLKYVDPNRLGKMRAFEHFGSLLGLLREQYVEKTYERYYQPKTGDVVVDVGAHVGTFTVRAARVVGDEGRVVAIEPEANNLSLLRRNIEANELQNVVVVPKGVWSTRGKATLKIFETGTGLHSFYDHAFDQSQEASAFEEVEVDTLDNMLAELGLGQVDFLKMDIEGAEVEALKGMGETLRSDVNVAIAAYHLVNGERTYKTIAPWLAQAGFELHVEGGMVYGGRKAA